MVDKLKRLGEVELKVKRGMVDLSPIYALVKVPVCVEIYPTKVSVTGHPIGSKRRAVIWVEADEKEEEKK